MAKIKQNFISIIIAISFVLIHIANAIMGDNTIFNALSGSGFHKLNNEFYRIFTGSFLHASLIHLIANILALLCIGSLIEKKLGWKWTLLLYLSSDIFSSIMFYGYMSECTGGNGSSIFLYSLMAILLISWLRYPNQFQMKWYNPVIIYLVIYFLVASFFGNDSTIIIHSFSFCIGLIEGLLLLNTPLLNGNYKKGQ